MARPEFTPIFEEGESVIKARMLGRIGNEWRKEPGDYMHDAIAASPQEVQQLQIRQDFILKSGFPQFAEAEFLDYWLTTVGLTRVQATPNERTLQVTADAGVTIPKGYTALSVVTDGEGTPYEFTVDELVSFSAASTKTVSLTCTITGVTTNLPTGTSFIFQPPIPGVRVITDQGTATPGRDIETDDAAYARYEFKMKNPDTGGNRTDYIRWAKTIDGVGNAKCLPRWNGNGTVKVVLVGTDFHPATAEVVAAVQTYIDPGQTGNGDGSAPCGALVTVVAASSLTIGITATVSYYNGADIAAVKAAFEAAVDKYLSEIAFVEINGDVNRNNVPVVIARIGSLLIGTEGVANYTMLKLNAGTIDVPVTTSQVAIRGAVTFS